jgi:diamine N-acetyltransferase
MTVEVELRDIATDSDRAAALALRRGPGQEEFVASVETSLGEAEAYPEACARYWAAYAGSEVVGFVMLSDGIPAATLAADATLLGPYYLWRLLIDERYQRRGYGTAAIDALVAYVRERPGADTLLVSCGQGEGSPQPFYERYGFVATGEFHEGEVVLALGLADR